MQEALERVPITVESGTLCDLACCIKHGMAKAREDAVGSGLPIILQPSLVDCSLHTE